MSFLSEDIEDLKHRISALERIVFKKPCKNNNIEGLDDRVLYLETSCNILARDKTEAMETEELAKANERLRIELRLHELNFQSYKRWIGEIWERRFGKLKTEIEALRLDVQEKMRKNS